MQEIELIQKIEEILKLRSETKNIELKKGAGGTNKVYDALSAFSNTEGGIIIFGIDENNDFKLTNVYDVQDIQTKICEQCKEMEPEVRPVITPINYKGCDLVSVEVPEIDYSLKPCYHKAKGQRKGSYIRIGNANEPMSEYEIYSYDAFKRQICDDIRKIDRALNKKIDTTKLDVYLAQLKQNRPNLASTSTQDLLELNSFFVDETPTLIYVLMFSIYPQAILPNLCAHAVVVPGFQVGEVTESGARFIDNKKIEGTLTEIIEESIGFVRKNMSHQTVINNITGQRTDIPEYPIAAIREAIINAVVHRDYSFHTENMPIQINMFTDRIEITNPGGLYGRLTVDDLGKIQPDTRNPNIAKALELLKVTENRYSGIPTIKKSMREANLPDPVFINERGCFKVILYNSKNVEERRSADPIKAVLDFCIEPRALVEIQNYLGFKSLSYVRNNFVKPLIENGQLLYTIPDKPGSKYQKYKTKR